MNLKTVFYAAVKVFYILPAVPWVMMTVLLILPIASWQEIFPVFWLYPTLPTAAAILLWRGKWWGCLPGIIMGAMLFALVPNEQVSGLRYCVYFAIMGLMCYVISRAKGENT